MKLVYKYTFEPFINVPNTRYLSHPCLELNCLVPFTKFFTGASQIIHFTLELFSKYNPFDNNLPT